MLEIRQRYTVKVGSKPAASACCKEATISVGTLSSCSTSRTVQLLNQDTQRQQFSSLPDHTRHYFRSRLNLAHYPRMHLPQPSAGTRHRYACDRQSSFQFITSQVIDKETFADWSRHCSSLQSVPGQSNRPWHPTRGRRRGGMVESQTDAAHQSQDAIALSSGDIASVLGDRC